jgi:hypothetical protein
MACNAIALHARSLGAKPKLPSFSVPGVLVILDLQSTSKIHEGTAEGSRI